MPTLLVVDGIRFFFFSNEGMEPPHVHVEAGDGAAKFWLEPTVELAFSVRLKTQELRRARLEIIQRQAEFRGRWREHFGT